MVAMGRFVSDEIRARHTAHVVVADSDMLVVKHLQDVNQRQWDVALTWRAQPALMRVNAGLVLFHGQRLQQVSHHSRACDARSLRQGVGRGGGGHNWDGICYTPVANTAPASVGAAVFSPSP